MSQNLPETANLREMFQNQAAINLRDLQVMFTSLQATRRGPQVMYIDLRAHLTGLRVAHLQAAFTDRQDLRDRLR